MVALVKAVLTRYEAHLTALGALAVLTWGSVHAPEWLWTKAGNLVERIWTDPAGFASGLTLVVGALVAAGGTLRAAWKRDPRGGT